MNKTCSVVPSRENFGSLFVQATGTGPGILLEWIINMLCSHLCVFVHAVISASSGIPPFIYQLFSEHLFSARCYTRFWRFCKGSSYSSCCHVVSWSLNM